MSCRPVTFRANFIEASLASAPLLAKKIRVKFDGRIVVSNCNNFAAWWRIGQTGTGILCDFLTLLKKSVRDDRTGMAQTGYSPACGQIHIFSPCLIPGIYPLAPFNRDRDFLKKMRRVLIFYGNRFLLRIHKFCHKGTKS